MSDVSPNAAIAIDSLRTDPLRLTCTTSGCKSSSSIRRASRNLERFHGSPLAKTRVLVIKKKATIGRSFGEYPKIDTNDFMVLNGVTRRPKNYLEVP